MACKCDVCEAKENCRCEWKGECKNKQNAKCSKGNLYYSAVQDTINIVCEEE